MTNDQKDAICQLWVEIFGTQEGIGYNCPQGAYDFAEVVMAYERERCANVCNEIGALEALDGEEGSAAMVRVADKQAALCAEAIRSRGEK